MKIEPIRAGGSTRNGPFNRERGRRTASPASLAGIKESVVKKEVERERERERDHLSRRRFNPDYSRIPVPTIT